MIDWQIHCLIDLFMLLITPNICLALFDYILHKSAFQYEYRYLVELSFTCYLLSFFAVFFLSFFKILWNDHWCKNHRKSIFLVCWLCWLFIVVVNIDAHKSKSMTKTDLLFYSVHELLGLIRLLGCNDNSRRKNMNKFAWAHISTYIRLFACWIPSNGRHTQLFRPLPKCVCFFIACALFVFIC